MVSQLPAFLLELALLKCFTMYSVLLVSPPLSQVGDRRYLTDFLSPLLCISEALAFLLGSVFYQSLSTRLHVSEMDLAR